MVEAAEAPFVCPSCGAHYKVVRLEVSQTSDEPDIECVNCGAALEGREGAFALKYFLVSHAAKRKRRQR